MPFGVKSEPSTIFSRALISSGGTMFTPFQLDGVDAILDALNDRDIQLDSVPSSGTVCTSVTSASAKPRF